MQAKQHSFIRKITDENPSIDASLLSEILSPKFMSPEFTGVKNIVEMLFHAHEVVLRIEWPNSEQLVLLKRYDTLLDVKNTEVYKTYTFDTGANPLVGNIKFFPFATLFAQPFHRHVTTEQKEVLSLLVLMFFQVLSNSNIENEEENRDLKNIAYSLRKLIEKVEEDHEVFNFKIPFESFKYKHLKDALNKIVQVKELNIDDCFSSKWEELSQSFTGLDNEEEGYKNTNNIYGNRLTTIELMQLPWRSNVLAEHEVSELITFIKHAFTKEESRKLAIFAMIVALTSKSFENISNIKIFSKTPESPSDDYIDLSSGTWVRKSIKMPDAYSQKESQEMCLSQHTQWLHLSLPNFLIGAIEAEHQTSGIGDGAIIGELCCGESSISTQLSSFLKPFWRDNLLIHRQITPAALRGLMFNKIVHKHDAAYTALLLANTEFINPTSLYYISAEAKKLASDYHLALGELGIETLPSQLNTNAMVGSELVLDISYINTVITKKSTTLSQMLKLDSTKLSFDELILRHNLFSCYITTMLLASTGHRDRTEFGFTPYIWNEDSGYILLSDKVNFEESAIRLLPLSNLVIEQLTAYKNFCIETAKHIDKFNGELAKKIATSAEFHSAQWPIISHLSNTNLRAVSNSDISKYFDAELNVPINCFRHLLSQHLSDGEEYSFSNSLMGHVNNNEHFLSDFSCASIADLKSVTTSLDNLLVKLGFTIVTYKPHRGPKYAIEMKGLDEGYRADFLYRSEDKELKALNKWGKNILKPHVEDFLNNETREKTQSIIIEEAQKDESCGINKRTRMHWLNQQIFNTLEKGSLCFTTETANLHLEVDALLKMQETRRIKAYINDLFFHEQTFNGLFCTVCDGSAELQLVNIVLSLIVNTNANISVNKKTIKVIQASPVFENGVAWFDFEKQNRVIIDSITLMLILKSSAYKNAVLSKNTFDKLITDKYLTGLSSIFLFTFLDIKSINAFESLDKLSKYIRDSRDENQSALAFSYQNGHLNTTSLSQEVLTRWLSSKPVKLLSAQIPIIQENVNALNSISGISSNDMSFKKSQEFLKQIQKALFKQDNEKRKTTTTDLLIQVWGEFIGCINETSINQLIEKSNMLNEVTVLLVLWAIDTSKKKNGSGRERAVRTPKTHLSNVAQPLLSQLEANNILDLTSDELAQVYTKAISSKNVKSKRARASEFRQFHHFLENHFDFYPLDWQEIEPSIDHDDEVNANIISMTEYSNMMSVLNNDECFNENDRRINQIILLLCYRIGLRVGEALFLMLQDIDIENWILHVRSYYYHRLKTSAANRRIPIALLLSDDEKELLIKQINLVKSHHTGLNNLWLFSDKANAQCRVNLNNNLSRVRETLRLVSGDDTLRLHHCRHSFANYLLLCMHDSYYPVAITSELKLWADTDDLTLFSVQLRQSYLSREKDKRQILHAIAKAMGHSSPATTLHHYIHVLDIIHASENEKCLFNINIKHEDHPEFIKKRKHPIFALVNINQANCNKILSRNAESLGYQPLVSHSQKEWGDYQRTAVSRSNREFILSNIISNKPQQRLNVLYDIEHVIRAAERGLSNVRITQLLSLDFQFVTEVVNTAIHLKKQMAYAGINIASDKKELTFETNQRRLLTASKYIRMPSFQVTLQKMVETLKDITQANYLSEVWRESYEKNRGLIIAPDDYEKFTLLISGFGYQVIKVDEKARVKRRYGYKTGILVKFYPITDDSQDRAYGDNKVHHALFLLTMFLMIQPEIN